MTPAAPIPALADTTVAIVGVGLLGGSLGMALEGHCAHRIGVVGRSEHAGRDALERGAVDTVDVLEAAVAAADLVVLATPVTSILDLLGTVATYATPGTLVTDLGSTKVAVVAAMEMLDGADGGRFVGGHPMCGGTEHGVANASADLFHGAAWALCPTSNASDDAVERVSELARALGARPILMAADEHDHAVALTSHLPYAVAQVLMHLLGDQPEAGRLTAAGWARSTRHATGDVSMWRDVLVTNTGPVVAAIDQLREALGELSTRLRENDPTLVDWLSLGARLAQRPPDDPA